MKTTCSKCENELTPNRIQAKQRYCNPCHAEHMRLTRPKHIELKPEARFKANVRGKSHYYVKTGLIQKKDCQECGSHESQIHHEDYNKPTEVTWLCRPCHLNFHRVKLTA